MHTLLFRPLYLFAFFIIAACSEQSTSVTRLELPQVTQYTSVPDFSSYKVVSEKKKAFFKFLKPIVIHENTIILNDRYFIEHCKKTLSGEKSLSEQERARLDKIAKRYKVDKEFNGADYWRLLLLRVDVIPVSLALSQAALESAWGGSRFAKEGNNLFGQWCFKAGCGLVPQQRQDGKSHEVAAFDTANLSVRKYLLNLNRLGSYKPLRTIRAELRQKQQTISGLALSKGLGKYSELGDKYIKHISGMITANKLEAHDQHALFLP